MKKIVILLILLFSLILTACGASAPTPSAEEAAAQLATMVAATVEAAQSADDASAPAVEEAPTEEAAAPSVVQTYSDFAGLRVAYVKDGNLYVWTEGGSSTLLVSGGDVRDIAISDDGLYIAYVRERLDTPFAFDLWFVNTEGTNIPTLLVSAEEMSALKDASPFTEYDGLGFGQVVWRPGTHVIAYSTVARYMGPGAPNGHDMRTINIDTMEKQTVFDFEEAGAFTFSPDGTQISISTGETLSLANADGSNLRANVLTFPRVSTYSEYTYQPLPVWAADSLSLRVGIPPADPLAEPNAPSVIWYLPVDGSAPTQVGSITPMPLYWLDRAISPDMSFVAYVKRFGEPTDNTTELHLAYVDGSNDYIFSTGGIINFFGWSPDATRFVYANNTPDDRGMYLGSISGGSEVITSDSQTVFNLQWVDASRFIFVANYNGKIELRISDQDNQNHAFIDSLTDQLAPFVFTP